MKKFTVILLFFILSANCAPPRNIRQESRGSRQPVESSIKSTFNWNAKEQENTFENSDYSNNNKNNYHAPNLYNSNRDYRSSGTITRYGTYNNSPELKYKNEHENNNYIRNRFDTNKDNFKITRYMVQKGDNLIQISKKFKISLNDLKTTNNIKNENKIYVGMILKIPNNGFQNRKSSDTKAIPGKNITFSWPLKKIYNTKQDGRDGVKPIGIIITGENGSSVFPSAAGIVSKIGDMRGYGNYIIIKHNSRYLTIYSNLKDIKVNEGDEVSSNISIGRVDGNKLHFQIGHSGKPENPLIYLSRKS